MVRAGLRGSTRLRGALGARRDEARCEAHLRDCKDGVGNLVRYAVRIYHLVSMPHALNTAPDGLRHIALPCLACRGRRSAGRSDPFGFH